MMIYYSVNLTPAQKKALLALAEDRNAKVHGRTLQGLLDWGGIEWCQAYGGGGYILNRWGLGAVREIKHLQRKAAK